MAVWFMIGMLVIVGWSHSAYAQTPEGEFQSWRVFTIARGSQKTCYVTGTPSAKTGAGQRGDIPYIVVTHRGKNLAEVSVSAGYAYRDKSTAQITVDKASHAFFTSAKTPKIAWARDAAEDKAVVGAMLQGSKMSVAGTGAGKVTSKDTYELQGFAPAYARMQELCSEDSKSAKTVAKKSDKASPKQDVKAAEKKEEPATPKQDRKTTAAKKDEKTSPKTEGKTASKPEPKARGTSEPKVATVTQGSTTASKSDTKVSKSDTKASPKASAKTKARRDEDDD